MRRRDISTRTQGSSSTGQSLRCVTILYSSFQSWFSVNTRLMNTSFFSLLLHLLYPHPFQNYIATLGYTGLWVQGFNTLQNEMGILLPFPALFLWEITLGTLIEQQEFKLHLCWLMPCKQHTTHTHTQVHTLGSPMQALKTHTRTHTQPSYCRMLKLDHSLPLFLSSSFIIVLPCGISSVFVLSHYITFSLLSFKHCIYSAIRDASFFFSGWHW